MDNRHTCASGPALGETAYRALLQQTQNVKPYTYKTVQAGLFESILLQKLPPGEGPQIGRPNVTVRPTVENSTAEN